MKYEKITRGIFLDRPNRFIAHVEIDGKVETVHVKNTGRCKELLVKGCTVILEDFRNRKGSENRKTKFDIIAVYKGNLLINMDSQVPNVVVKEWLLSNNIRNGIFNDENSDGNFHFDFVKPEFVYGNSRIDFYMENENFPAERFSKELLRNSLVDGSIEILKRVQDDGNLEKVKRVQDDGDGSPQRYLMEVKGCTLEIDGIGYFPDAPTERGVKHLKELTQASLDGINCYVAFVIQVPGVEKVLPNIKTHPEFGEALENAKKAGVKVLFLQTKITEDEIYIYNEILNI